MLQRSVLMALLAVMSLQIQLTASARNRNESRAHATILAVGAKVANWQLRHMSNFDYIPADQYRRAAEAPLDWVQAAFYIGLAAFADATHDMRYQNAIIAHGEAQAWGFDARPRHADADATGAVWVWAAQRTHDPARLAPTRGRFDAVLAHPSTEVLFKRMAARLVRLQGARGYWPASLLEPQKTPETSGTGFFVYGLAWGIQHGLLPSADYRHAVDRGWHALVAAVGANGKLGWVQPVGAAPDRVKAGDTQLYGVGAFLLAASEMSALP